MLSGYQVPLLLPLTCRAYEPQSSRVGPVLSIFMLTRFKLKVGLGSLHLDAVAVK